MNSNLSVLQTKLGYKFNNQELLVEALSHPSINHKNRKNSKNYEPNYERLEFFGDAILNMVISEELFHKYQGSDEGNLAKRRAYLICKDTICEVAEKFEIERYIIMTEGEERNGGRKNLSNVENAFEATFAAIYLDSKKIEIIRSLILKWWSPFIDGEYIPSEIDPKSALQEMLQSKKFPTPQYTLLSSAGGAHNPVFTIQLLVPGIEPSIASGETKKEAEKKAASLMLSKLKNASRDVMF